MPYKSRSHTRTNALGFGGYGPSPSIDSASGSDTGGMTSWGTYGA